MSLQGGVEGSEAFSAYLSLLVGMGWGLIPCSRVIQQCFEGALAPHAAISTTFGILSTTVLFCHSCHKFIVSPDNNQEFSDSSSPINTLFSLQTINFGPCLAEQHDPSRRTKLGSHIRAVYVCSAVQNIRGKKVQDLHHLRSAALLGSQLLSDYR